MSARTPATPGSLSVRAVAGCAALATLSLLVADRPAYDPTAWLIWGRQISEGMLETVAGPSWKPLPVGVTAPAALVGDDVAVWSWLAVARTGGLLALVLAYRLAARLGGRGSGVVAVLALALASTFLSGVVRGNSEGLLVALVLLAIDRQLSGRSDQAFAFGTVAALLRPEVWPLLALQGLWLLREDRRRGRPAWRRLSVLALCAAGVLAAWFVPERIGSGDFLRAAARAREPVADSPAQAARPFAAVFSNSASALAYPVYALAVLAVADGWRRRRWELLAVAGVSSAWMLCVALLAEAGFTGNLRYVMLPAALVCVLAGAGWAAGLRIAGTRRSLVAAAAAAAAPGLVVAAIALAQEAQRVAADERFYDALDLAVARAGGAGAIDRCGIVLTGPFQTQAVAWELHRFQQQVGLRGDPPGTVLARPGSEVGEDARFDLVDDAGEWIVRQRCR